MLPAVKEEVGAGRSGSGARAPTFFRQFEGLGVHGAASSYQLFNLSAGSNQELNLSICRHLGCWLSNKTNIQWQVQSHGSSAILPKHSLKLP